MLAAIALPRGASLYAERVAGARSFSVGFWFQIGSRHEEEHERGFAHFSEHLLFKGTATRSALDIARAIDRVGGYLNAFTERDTLCVHCTVPARHWELALELLADLCFSSTFPPEEVEREREVIESEILAARDDPEECVNDLLLEMIWPGDPLARPIAGSEKDIRSADRDQLFAFSRGTLRPERLLVTLAGPEEAAQASARLGRLLDALPEPPVPAKVLPSPVEPHWRGGIRAVPERLSQAYLLVALPWHPPFLDRDYYAMSVLNGAFGESMSSRLFQGLREKEGLCYSVASGFSLSRTEGLWVAQASSSVKSFPELLASLEREIDELSGDRPLTAQEISESLSRLEGGFDLSLDDPEYRMKRLARQALETDQVLDIEETRARIIAVDPEEIAAMTRRVFAGEDRAILAYGRLGAKGERIMAARAGSPAHA